MRTCAAQALVPPVMPTAQRLSRSVAVILLCDRGLGLVQVASASAAAGAAPLCVTAPERAGRNCSP